MCATHKRGALNAISEAHWNVLLPDARFTDCSADVAQTKVFRPAQTKVFWPIQTKVCRPAQIKVFRFEWSKRTLILLLSAMHAPGRSCCYCWPLPALEARQPQNRFV